jgi:hypothetical protein
LGGFRKGDRWSLLPIRKGNSGGKIQGLKTIGLGKKEDFYKGQQRTATKADEDCASPERPIIGLRNW